MTVAVGPAPEFLEDPCALRGWRIDETITDGLRARALLFGVAGIPVPIVLETGERGLLLLGQILRHRLARREQRHVAVHGDAVLGLREAHRVGHRGAPVTALRDVAVVAEA